MLPRNPRRNPRSPRRNPRRKARNPINPRSSVFKANALTNVGKRRRKDKNVNQNGRFAAKT